MAKETKGNPLTRYLSSAKNVDVAMFQRLVDAVEKNKLSKTFVTDALKRIKDDPDSLKDVVATAEKAKVTTKKGQVGRPKTVATVGADKPTGLDLFAAMKKKAKEKPKPEAEVQGVDLATVSDDELGLSPPVIESPAHPKPVSNKLPFAAVDPARIPVAPAQIPAEAMAGGGQALQAAPAAVPSETVQVPGLTNTPRQGRGGPLIGLPPRQSMEAMASAAIGASQGGAPVGGGGVPAGPQGGPQLPAKGKGRFGKWALALSALGMVGAHMVRRQPLKPADEQLAEYERQRQQDMAIEQFKEQQPTLFEAAMNFMAGKPVAPPMTGSEVLIGTSGKASPDEVPHAVQRAVIGALAGIR